METKENHMFLPHKILAQRLLSMLEEDLGQGDITTSLIVPENSSSEAELIARQNGIVAGIEEGKILLESLELAAEALVKDGDVIKPKQILMRITGSTRTILSVERTLLNVITRMSGIATATHKIVNSLEEAGFKTKVAGTRKTAPGLLYFDKKAILIGGGDPHRLHLDDMILIKDNHIAVAGSVKKALKTAKKSAPFVKKIEIEVTRREDVIDAIKSGADVVMLDNFTPREIIKTIDELKRAKLYGRVVLEASGGIASENVCDFARTGVDVVSLGEITHSPRALNISLELTHTSNY
jgi:nicotinate-nucleotide pyrophosphorylase (carboxylating)